MPRPAAAPFDPSARSAALKAQGAAIAAARRARGLTQAEAAAVLGVPVATLKSWESGLRGSPASARATLATWAPDAATRAALAVDTRHCPCCGRPYGGRGD